MHQLLVIKSRKNYEYHYFYDLLHHDASTNQCDGLLSVALFVPPMLSIGGDDDCTFMLYMSPLKNSVHGLPCHPLGEHGGRNCRGIVWYSKFSAQNGI